MNESEENFGLEDNNLSLIDVSFEDDSLYNSPPRDNQLIQQSLDNQTGNKNVELFGILDNASNVQFSVDSIEWGGREPQPIESVESEGMRKNGKYNLRKSLAWDSAFFTSAGVLEPDELSCMIGGAEKGGKRILPAIEEDVHRSTDSISTLASDNLTLENLEDDLFGDIRASIQKSSKASNVANPSSQVGSGITDNKIIQSSEKLDIASQNKLKTKAPSKRPNLVKQGSGKIIKQVSLRTQASQIVATTKDSTSSLCKPPKVGGRVSPILTAPAKRASLGNNHVKVEKDNAKNSTVAGRGMKTPPLGSSRNTMPRPKLSSKSSLGSSVATKTELTTSTSSLDSSGSLSSDSSGKTLHPVKRKIDSGTGTQFSSGSSVQNTLRIPSRNKNRSSTSLLKSVTKVSFSISPASSISEWSAESLSPTSTLNKRSKSSSPSLDSSSCKDASGNSDASQVFVLQSQSNDKCSVGHGAHVTGLLNECPNRVSMGNVALLQPDCIKPSGLRLPSPKIGFFDGVRSAARTPNGSMQSHATVLGGLPKLGVRSVSPRRGSNEAKPRKQPARTLMADQNTKIGPQQPALGTKPKSPLPLQEPSNATPKVRSASRSEKSFPGMSLKVRNRMSPDNGRESMLKIEQVASKESNTEAISKPDFGFAKTSPESKGITPIKVAEITPTSGGLEATHDSSSSYEVKNISLSEKAVEVAIFDQNYIANNLHSLYNTNEKENACLKDPVDGLTKQLEAVDIRETKKEPVGDYLSLHPVNIGREVNCIGQEEFLKLSKPIPLIPTTGPTGAGREDSHLTLAREYNEKS